VLLLSVVRRYGRCARDKDTDGIQDLQGARLDRRGACLSVPLYLPLDKTHPYAVAGEFARSEQARGAGTDNQDIILRQQPRILLGPAEVLKA
jgi:hypothetical protein